METTKICLVLYCINTSLDYVDNLVKISINSSRIKSYLLMKQELRRYKYKTAKQKLNELDYVCLYSLIEQANQEYKKRSILM